MKKTGILFGVFLLLYSCVSENRKLAEEQLTKASQLIQSGDMVKGIGVLDSIQVWYPEEYKIIGEALQLKKDAAQAYHKEFIRQAQTLLDSLAPTIDKLSKDFVFTPGPPGRPGFWEHKRQTVRNSWNRIFLKVNVMENGEFWISTHYYGHEWLDHTSIKVYDRDLYTFSDTIALNDPDNHKIEDASDRWEKIDFKKGRDGGIVAFIVQNQNLNLKVRFTGKKHYYIVMEAYDKEAVKNGYELAQVLKEAFELRQKIDQHNKELRLLGVSAD